MDADRPYAAARLLQGFAGRIPMIAIVALHVVPPAAFSVVHGRARYGLGAMAAFTACCLVIGNLFENLGVLTGFPYGHYHFTDVMGPKLWNVPVLLGPAYMGMGYLSWTLGVLMVGERSPGALALAAALPMVSWDLAMDPVWSTLLRAWIWHDGGVWFGVPVSNYLGWFLTVFLVWKMAVWFYGISAAGNLLVPAAEAATVTDAGGTVWQTAGLRGACRLVSIFVMGAWTLLAWARIPRERA